MRRKQKDYLPEDSVYPLMGLNTADPSTMTDPHFQTVADNLNVNKGIIRKRLGYQLLGQLQKTNDDTTTTLVTDPILALIEFQDSNNTLYLIALTPKRQYYWEEGTPQWVDITKGVAGHTVVEWTGGEDDPIDWAIGTDGTGRQLIITNGKDTPRVFKGSDASPLEFTDLSTDITGFVTCQTVAIFQNMLVMGNVTTSDREPSVFLWSKPGDFTNYTDLLAGFLLLTSSLGDILKLQPMGDQLIIYSENSIDVATYLGSPILFATQTVVRNTRLLSGRGIVDIGPYHLYMNEENIYLFDGTRLIKPIADVVRDQYREDLSLQYPDRATGFLDNIENQIYFIIANTTDVNYVYKLEYDVGSHIGYDLASNLGGAKGNRWVREILHEKPQSMGYLRRIADLTWVSDTDYGNTWDEEAGIWFDRQLRADFPLRVIGSNGFVYVYDGTTFNDAGNVVTAQLDTMDFIVPQSYISSLGRWVEVEMEVKGISVDVYFSTDHGQTYTLIESRNLLGTDFTRQKFFCDTTAQSFRVSIRNSQSSGYFELRWLRVWVQESGPR